MLGVLYEVKETDLSEDQVRLAVCHTVLATEPFVVLSCQIRYKNPLQNL